MRYSVWNTSARAYDYYDVSGTAGTHVNEASRRSKRPLGATPEEAACRLPAGARKVGSGHAPQGRIASLGCADDPLGDALDNLPSWWPLGAVAIGYLVWRSR